MRLDKARGDLAARRAALAAQAAQAAPRAAERQAAEQVAPLEARRQELLAALEEARPPSMRALLLWPAAEEGVAASEAAGLRATLEVTSTYLSTHTLRLTPHSLYLTPHT